MWFDISRASDEGEKGERREFKTIEELLAFADEINTPIILDGWENKDGSYDIMIYDAYLE